VACSKSFKCLLTNRARRAALLLIFVLFSPSAALRAAAQPASAAFPQRMITLVLPGAAGGGADQVARIVGRGLAARLGVPVVVENKAGATGMIGAESVARAEPNGSKLLFAFTALVQAPAVFARVPYDIEKDFVPLAQIANAPVFLGVRADSQIKSVGELIQQGKGNAHPLSYGTFGVGSSYHIYGQALARSQGLNLLHVPYKGEGLALQDLLGGVLDVSFMSVGTGAPQVKAGKIRAIAMVAKSRSSLLPSVPTFAEAGVAGVDAMGWFGMLAPAGTPASVTSRLASEINAVMSDKTVQERLRELGYEPVSDSTPESFHAFLRTEVKLWQKLISDAGVKAE
jgi:tripartite-type tricarboxylate transporter receptor subunit TctC